MPSHAQADAALPPAASQALPAMALAGEGELRWWGLDVYRARLWAAAGATARAIDAQPLALELAYRRAFKSADIARVSIEQMQRAGEIAPAQAERWTAQLRRVIPDVAAGDRLLGVHVPGQGARFFFNGKPAGEIADDAFSRRFFGIWLAPTTSEPGLRAALVGGLPP